jgi:CBS domain-containing protein
VRRHLVGAAQDREEIAMYEQPVRQVMAGAELLTAPPRTTVAEAAQLMASRHTGAVVVVDGEHVVGIFTERDAVFRVIAMGLDARTTQVADVMTPAPVTIAPEKPFGVALTIMHKKGFRHLPVVEGGRPIGIVSARMALDPDMEDFVAEARRRARFESE